MRLALISDLHGNLTALDAALSDIRRRGADQIVCLGDVASDGPQPLQVLERLRRLECPVIMGNADAQLIERDPIDDSPAMRIYADNARWAAALLSQEDQRFIKGFLPNLKLQLGPRGALLFHGTPADFNAELRPETEDSVFREAFAGHGAALYAGGHTHMQMFRRIDEAVFVNPGSVGMAYDRTPAAPGRVRLAAWAEYALISVSEAGFGCELLRIGYQPDEVVAAVSASDMPNRERWIAAWSRAARL